VHDAVRVQVRRDLSDDVAGQKLQSAGWDTIWGRHWLDGEAEDAWNMDDKVKTDKNFCLQERTRPSKSLTEDRPL
jgi:hypothetical protein